MANWCSNMVGFTGEPGQLAKLNVFLLVMIERQKKNGNGQIPDFIKGDSGWLFDIQWDSEVLRYETRWSPNMEVLKQLADRFEVGFVYSYSEPMNKIAGTIIYKDNKN